MITDNVTMVCWNQLLLKEIIRLKQKKTILVFIGILIGVSIFFLSNFITQ